MGFEAQWAPVPDWVKNLDPGVNAHASLAHL